MPFLVAQSDVAADLKFVAAASSAGPGTTMIVAMPNSPVKTVRDLAGERPGPAAEPDLGCQDIRTVWFEAAGRTVP
ncbi:MAG TPA: hypothetical protein VH419_14530 [Nocardioidaceae bacterium]